MLQERIVEEDLLKKCLVDALDDYIFLDDLLPEKEQTYPTLRELLKRENQALIDKARGE